MNQYNPPMPLVAVDAAATDAIPATDRRKYRLTSIDIVRGLVIIIMALDHVRDNMMIASVQDPTADPTASPLLFATRWITHFCAPTFVFLAGVSAGLMSRRKSPAELARFLALRGLWLILVEVLVISTAASFAPGGIPQLGGRTLVGLQVIWAIGASMIVLSGTQFLGPRACFAIGLLIVFGHNVLDAVWPPASMTGSTGPLWVVLHARQSYAVGPFWIFFSYPLLPWIGIMLLGYAAAGLFQADEPRRNRGLIRIGAALAIGFVILRALNIYGDPHAWQVLPDNLSGSLMSFLAVTKYPPSLLYTLATLGPAAIVCGYADRLPGMIRHVLLQYGRSPFAFYVAHFYLIHTLSVLLGMAEGFQARQMFTHYRFYPKGYGVGLEGVYLFWILVVVLLYPLCRYVTAVKARRTDWWLSFL
ncbi:MAG: DUF1624 domain-containing protein [Proteobacteria bacterium]|nr:DUF1624 domain-containing protein [Pseudomonadota bacterium]